jgi:putative PIN family toxin of toxin-antitoxin system
VRIVLDTNVLISGIFFSGPPYQILEAWRDGIVQIAISPEILAEYQRVGQILAQDFPNINLEPVLNHLILNTEVYIAPPLPAPVCKDPDDDKFLACALVSQSIIVVSGDRHLLEVSGYQNIQVIKPSEFVSRYLQGE